jgi:hypothetical protein
MANKELSNALADDVSDWFIVTIALLQIERH